MLRINAKFITAPGQDEFAVFFFDCAQLYRKSRMSDTPAGSH